jgi:hypothetical protein
MKATTNNGKLRYLEDCYIVVLISGENYTIVMDNLPDISDTKSASYPDENAIGRSMPFKSYRNSENRSISWTAHFFVQKDGDQDEILDVLRLIESCLYPTSPTGSAYAPPPICRLRCGKLLKKEGELCAVMKSYSVKFDTSVPWDEINFMPYKLDVDMQFDVIYDQSDLPGAETILKD